MSTAQIDHILTFANVSNIDEHVEDYRSRGFLISDATHRYQPGLRNRFITSGCEYVELAWVEEETVFAAGGNEEFARMFSDLPLLCLGARPFGIGFKSASVEALHRVWTERGYDLPAVWSFAPPGLPPVFSFQPIPSDLLPGVQSFVLTYHNGAEDSVRQVPVAPNTIYALEGMTLVCTTPKKDATRWRDLLAPSATIQQNEGVYSIIMGAHTVHWIAPEQYRALYNLTWIEPPHRFGGIAALHLLASNLDQAEALLGTGVKHIRNAATGHQFLMMEPNAHDGLMFTIREYPIESWRLERTSRTAERLVVQDS
jgi:hypothetical protein